MEPIHFCDNTPRTAVCGQDLQADNFKLFYDATSNAVKGVTCVKCLEWLKTRGVRVEPKIVKAEVIMPTMFGEQARVKVDFDDGTVGKTVIHFFHDELSFMESEFIGLTEREAGELHMKKDKAFLQS